MTVTGRLGGALLRRTPRRWLLVALAGIGLWKGLRWLAVHLAVTAALALAVLAWWVIDRGGWPWLLLATGCLCVGLGGVMELRPTWWVRLVTAVASRRRLSWYRARWEPAMIGAGLTLGDDLPELLGHRFGGAAGERDTDVLRVRTVPGQVLEDWRHVAGRLAAAWGRTRIRPHSLRHDGDRAPAVLELYCTSRPLAADRRAAVVGGQVPPSTPVEEPVDEAAPQPRGAFPRTPRGEP